MAQDNRWEAKINILWTQMLKRDQSKKWRNYILLTVITCQANLIIQGISLQSVVVSSLITRLMTPSQWWIPHHTDKSSNQAPFSTKISQLLSMEVNSPVRKFSLEIQMLCQEFSLVTTSMGTSISNQSLKVWSQLMDTAKEKFERSKRAPDKPMNALNFTEY